MAIQASLMLYGGPIVTMDQQGTVAEAVAISGDRIVAVGSLAEVEAATGPQTRRIDLAGRMAVPGLIDAHMHLFSYGMFLEGIDFKNPPAKSVADMMAAVAKRADQTPPGEWIHGRGYDHTLLAERRHPNRYDLDPVSPSNPVVITRTCAHIVVANSLALQLAGVTRETPDPPGGEIERDAAGEPTGVLKETARELVARLLPETPQTLSNRLGLASREMVKWGITSVHEARSAHPRHLQALRAATSDQVCQVRVYAMMHFGMDRRGLGEQMLEPAIGTGFGDERLRLGPLKVVLDGSSSGPTCATKQPYTSMPDYSGILCHEQPALNAVVAAAHANGFQASAHCVGDRAVEMMVSAIEAAQAAHPRAGARHRIEHCAMMDPALIQRVKAAGIVPVAQPIFFWEFGDGYLRNYGPERTRWMFPVRSLLAAGVPVALSSDCPVTTGNPMAGIAQAMSRRTKGGGCAGEEEVIDAMTALRGYTVNAAYASGEERYKGSLEVGKLADVTVLSGDLLRSEAEAIREMQCHLTVIGGQVVWDALG